MSSGPSRKLMVGVFAAAFVVGFSAYLARPMKILATMWPDTEKPIPSPRVSGDSERLDIDGGAVSGAGGAVVTIKTPPLTYRQSCRDGCDGLRIDYEMPPSGGSAVIVTGADGRTVFEGGTYDDAGVTHRLVEGPDRRLRMDSGAAGSH